MNKTLTAIIMLVCAASGIAAQNVVTIADRINAKGTATVTQPAGLNERLKPATTEVATDADAEVHAASQARQAGGYRIQMFSGNNARTAKNEASARAAKIETQFPEFATYVNYDAPYWRLKVGDFRTYEEASAALTRLKAAIPEHAREMRVVRDRIKL